MSCDVVLARPYNTIGDFGLHCPLVNVSSGLIVPCSVALCVHCLDETSYKSDGKRQDSPEMRFDTSGAPGSKDKWGRRSVREREQSPSIYSCLMNCSVQLDGERYQSSGVGWEEEFVRKARRGCFTL
ncbi:hypothetical protein BgiMline_032716 [Biomphalaria glabrata]